MIRTIIQEGDEILRNKSRHVTKGEIGSKELTSLIEDMKETLEATADGVALAAPQVGENLRLFVVSPKAYGKEYDKEKDRLVFVNPCITNKSSKKVELDEGCLSVRDIYGKIDRYDKVTVEALDESGKLFVDGKSGLLAEIYQHEIDHLDGVLFIDTARDLHEVEREEETTNKDGD